MPTTYDLGMELTRLDVEDNVFVGLMHCGTANTECFAVFGKCTNPKLTKTEMYTFAYKGIRTFAVDADINIKPLANNDCLFKMIKLDKKEDYEIVKRAVFAALK